MLEARIDNLTLQLKPDRPEVGVYLYVFRGDTCIRDELQDNIETCKQMAFEDYRVSPDRWMKVEVPDQE